MVEIQYYATNVASGVPIEIYWGLLGLFVVGLLILIWWKGFKRGLRYGTVLLLAEWVFLVLSILNKELYVTPLICLYGLI